MEDEPQNELERLTEDELERLVQETVAIGGRADWAEEIARRYPEWVDRISPYQLRPDLFTGDKILAQILEARRKLKDGN